VNVNHYSASVEVSCKLSPERNSLRRINATKVIKGMELSGDDSVALQLGKVATC
jgi:hypothetical protein